jgi:hypothetical protein
MRPFPPHESSQVEGLEGERHLLGHLAHVARQVTASAMRHHTSLKVGEDHCEAASRISATTA